MNGFIEWWQHLPGTIDPVAFRIGEFPVHWYSVMWLVAWGTAYLTTLWRVKFDKLPWTRQLVGDLFFWTLVGMLVGGRLGYIVFYGFGMLMRDPLRLLLPVAKIDGHWVFTGLSGLSFHGGVIGAVLAGWLLARRRNVRFLALSDLFVVTVALGYMFGRLGNFLNGELYGRVTTAAVGMYFPAAGDALLHHPSQLYEALFEGPVLFAVMWALRNRAPYTGFLTGVYFFGYAVARFFIEFFREPDAHLGFIVARLSMGQILCLAMMIGALAWLWVVRKLELRRSEASAKVRARRRRVHEGDRGA